MDRVNTPHLIKNRTSTPYSILYSYLKIKEKNYVVIVNEKKSIMVLVLGIQI